MDMTTILREYIMPTIVKHFDKKTGKTRVYEFTPHYDPVTKQSRPKRKYLGTLDPETNELIPSSGRRGRSAVSKNTTTIQNDSSLDRISVLKKIISDKDAEISSLKVEVKILKPAIKAYEKACGSISKTLASLPDSL